MNVASLAARLLRLSPINLVLAVSLLVVGYVGYGESHRAFPVFVLDKVAADSQQIKATLDGYLQAGLPLRQFPGFKPLTDSILQADDSLIAISVVTVKGEVVFENFEEQDRSFVVSHMHESHESFAQILGNLVPQKKGDAQPYQVIETRSAYDIVLPIQNKFETVGYLRLTSPKNLIEKTINGYFFWVFVVLIVLVLAYYGFLLATEARWGTSERRWLQVSYGLVFFAMAGFVVYTLINIYSDGIQEKTKVLANTLAFRLNKVIELGLTLDDIDGLDRALGDYKRLNPDISYVALIQGGRVLIHTDESQRGKRWVSQPNHYEFTAPLSASETTDREAIRTSTLVGIEKSVVYTQLWRNIKNFSVLFIASAFISFFLLDMLLSLRRQGRERAGEEEEKEEEEEEEAMRDLKVDLVRPVYFLGVFIEGLHVSFLPQFFQQVTQTSHVSPSLTSTLFTLFFAAFAFTLLPAGRYAETRGVKPLLIWGVVLSALGLAAMAMVTDFYVMALLRIMCGIGQGLLFIGCQSYIVMMASSSRKTQAAAIIVFGYNGGFISGAALGALLVTYMGTSGVFLLAAVLGMCILVYVLTMIEDVPAELRAPEAVSEGIGGRMLALMGAVLADFQFVKAMFFVGIVTKAALTGVTIFALPILMARLNYAQEDIGQILMFYSGGVLISSHVVSRLADRTGKTGPLLFWGSIGSGIGLVLIGLMGWETSATAHMPVLATGILIAGMVVLGLAHGFINAPIITHIGNTPVAGQVGRASTIAIYRFMERIGHIMGPIIVGQLLLANSLDPITISWIGIATVVLGLAFIVAPGGKRPAMHTT
jgi:MFS family permease